MQRRAWRLLVVIGSVLVAQCGSHNDVSVMQPSPTLSISCPTAPAPATSTTTQFASVTYAAATTTGGTQPVTVSCSPASGTPFPVGATTVNCTATDKSQRTASCSFSVSVLASPTLRIRTILAFGDSLTAGEVPDNCEFVCRYNTYPTESYPAVLTNMLSGRYVAQRASLVNAYTLTTPDTTDCTPDPAAPTTAGILVINAGCNGQPAAGTTTAQRLTDKVQAYRPDLVLLLLGTNDPDAAGAQAVQSLAATLVSRGVPVFVGTLPPEVPGEFSHGGNEDAVTLFNSQLKALVPQTGATIVDLYSGLASDETDWISPYDGLHLTAAGYSEMARVWFAAIQSRFEVSGGTPAGTSRNPTFPTLLARGTR